MEPLSRPEVVERALGALEYGSVALNVWTVLGFMASGKGGTWGAHPFASDGDRSGRGANGNIYAKRHAVNTVVRGGSLENPAVDFATLAPPIVYDALYVALIRATSRRAAFRSLVALLTRRLLRKLLFFKGPKGKYGAAI